MGQHRTRATNAQDIAGENQRSGVIDAVSENRQHDVTPVVRVAEYHGQRITRTVGRISAPASESLTDGDNQPYQLHYWALL
jgi:predicted lactoylglutathione lyase